MAATYRLTVEYDGTRFHGWQVQRNARSIAGELLRALREAGYEPGELGGSGRTDAEGIAELARLVAPSGYRVRATPVRGCLHLKSAVTDVAGDTLANGRILIAAEPGGTPDGLRCDVDGNLWCGWGMGAQQDGVRIFDPSGKPIGFIALPERCANVCFGGAKRNRLFMAASHSIYALYVNTQGAPGG